MKIQSFMMITIFCTVICGGFTNAEQFQSNKDLARSEWIKGFHKIEEAEYSEEFGNYQKALDLFNDAKRIFARVQKIYNKWNQSLLNFRIKYCEQKIRKIEKLSGLTGKDIDEISSLTKQKAELDELNQILEKRSEVLESENLKLRKEIDELAQKLDDSKNLRESNTKAIVLEKELHRLKRQLNESEMLKENLEIQTSDLEKEIVRLRSEQEKSIVKIAEKDQDNKLLKTQIIEFESKVDNKEQLSQTKQRRIQELTRQLEGAKKIQTKLDKSVMDLKKTQDSKTELTQQIEALKTHLKEQGKQVELVKNELQEKITRLQVLEDQKLIENEQIKKKLEEVQQEFTASKNLNALFQDTLKKQATLIEEMKEGITTLNDQIIRADKIMVEFSDSDQSNPVRNRELESIQKGTSLEKPKQTAVSLTPETTDKFRTSLEKLEMSKLMMESGNFNGAEKLWIESMSQVPPDAQLISQIGSLFLKANRNVSAISTLKKALSVFPNNPEILRLLGLAYFRVGKLESAEIQLKRSFELQKENWETALTLALLYAETEPLQIEDVREWYKLARSLGCPADSNLNDLVKEYSSLDYLSK